ncbi:YopX family protein [Listeria monocytogenes]|uniref:YopX family protein n=1 Tax=Listeria monocytogenes TaxID=1639 RepID=UPI00264BC969|nr:YopX family protein [Listeria monocytogenes]MDN7272969.1 YopX family protein [Listeria monocytogenes]
MCEFCTSDNTKLELECVGDYAHVKLESCINFLGDSVHCLAVEDEGHFAISLWSEINEIEVIGNIHENPELLEVAT